MPRIRTIKPDFFKDDDLAELPFQHRLLFAGLWTQADRAGRLENRPKRLKAEIFPYDNLDVEKLLSKLEHPQLSCRPQKQFISRYEVNGEKYIEIIGFLEHQRPHHTELESTIPPYNGASTVKEPLDNGDAPDGRERKGREGKEKPIGHSRNDLHREKFENIWEDYPEKKQKEKSWLKFKNQVKTEADWKDIQKALNNYKADVERIRANGQPDLQWQYGLTWFNSNWKDYIHYKPSPKKTPDGIARTPQLTQQELKAKIKEQIDFVRGELKEGIKRDFAWLHIALGKHIVEYEDRFREDPLSGDDREWFDQQRRELSKVEVEYAHDNTV